MATELDEVNRSRLDGIVQQAIKNGETDDTINSIVNDYKSKYAAPAPSPAEQITNRVAIRKASPTRGQLPEGKTMTETMLNSLAEPAVNALPMVGSEEGPLGTTAGSFLKAGLQRLLPKIFGQPSDTPISDTGKDLVFNNLIPSAAGVALSPEARATALASPIMRRISPSVRATLEDARIAENVANVKQFQALGDDGQPLVNIAPRNVPPTPRAKPLTFSQRMTNSFQNQDRALAEDEANQFNKPNYLDKQLSDLTPQDRLAIPQTTASSANALINKGLSSDGTLDATAILDEMNKNSDKYKFMNPDVKDNLKNFLTEVQSQKPLAKTGADNLLRYSRNRLILSAPAAILGGPTVGVATAGTLILGEAAIKAALQNPNTAKLLVQAVKTPSAAPEASLLTKTLLNGLKGTSFILRQKDDKDITATVGPDGQLQYQKP